MLARGDFEARKNFTILAQQRGGTGFGGAVDGENIHAAMIEEILGQYIYLGRAAQAQQKTLSGMTGLFLIFMSLRLLCIHPAFINKAFSRIHRMLTGQQ
jgi:hypothetical protein